MTVSTPSPTIPDSATAGRRSPHPSSEARARRRLRPPFVSSVTGSLAILAAIFLAVPALLYSQFQAADADKQALLLRSVQTQGRLVAEVLRPALAAADLDTAQTVLETRVGDLAGPGAAVRLLFRPAGAAESASAFVVAAMPSVPTALLAAERERLVRLGVLDRLQATCAGGGPVAIRSSGPGGTEETVTSVTAVHTELGCWVVITAHATAAYGLPSLDRPYWETPEIRSAGAIYVVMVILVVAVFLGVWRNLRRFTRLARDIRVRGTKGRTFAADSGFREFAQAAGELDRLVETLERSARTVRQAAEENAHALKTPVAIIRQSVEPLRRAVAGDNPRGQRALALIEESADRLTSLIACVRRMDEVVADLMDPPREPVDLSSLVRTMIDGWQGALAVRQVSARATIDEAIVVHASEDSLETMIENLLENAARFSPAGGTMAVRLERNGGRAEITVEDDGPGVVPDRLETIFERYYSQSPAPPDGTPGDEDEHLGIGLWIVRRNAEALGGSVIAENRAGGGLRVRLSLPLAA